MDMFHKEPAPVWNSSTSMDVLAVAHELPGEPITTEDLLRHVDNQFGSDVGRKGRIYADKLGIHTRYLSRDLRQRREQPRRVHRNP